MAYGDRRKSVSALVSLDPDNIRDWAGANGLDSMEIPELAAHARVRDLIEGEVARLNGQLASFETVKKFCILPRDFSIEAGELTPTLKIKRKTIAEKYAEQIDALY